MTKLANYTRMYQRRNVVSVLIWLIPSLIFTVFLLAIINEWLLFDKVQPSAFEPQESLYESNHQLTDFNLNGKDEEGRFYKLLAEHATQWATNNNNFEFGAFSFSIPIGDNTNIDFKSSYGSYFQKAQLLSMGSPVSLELNNKQSFSADTISVSLKKLTIEAKGNIVVDYAPITVKASQLVINTKDRSIELSGRVHIHISPWSRLK